MELSTGDVSNSFTDTIGPFGPKNVRGHKPAYVELGEFNLTTIN